MPAFASHPVASPVLLDHVIALRAPFSVGLHDRAGAWRAGLGECRPWRSEIPNPYPPTPNGHICPQAQHACIQLPVADSFSFLSNHRENCSRDARLRLTHLSGRYVRQAMSTGSPDRNSTNMGRRRACAHVLGKWTSREHWKQKTNPQSHLVSLSPRSLALMTFAQLGAGQCFRKGFSLMY